MRDRRLGAMLAAFGLAVAGWVRPALAAPGPPRVLELFEDDPDTTLVNGIFKTQFHASMFSVPDVELHTEHFDGGHISERSYRDAFRQWVAARHADAPPSVIVAVGEGAVEFLSDPDATPWRDVPVVYAVVDDRLPGVSRLPPNFTGVLDRVPVRQTLDLALKLFPSTRHLFVIGGATRRDRLYTDLLWREAAAYRDRLEIVELVGLPVPDLLDRVRALPRDSILLSAPYAADSSGRRWNGREVSRLIAQLHRAPLFSVQGPILGYGAVGGVMINYEETAERAAGLVKRILAGEGPRAIPVETGGPYRTLLDGRELDRWGIRDARVPSAAEIQFRETATLRRYVVQILVVCSALLIQTALIGLLLLERRGRRVAERRAREDQAVIAHLNRVGAIGELAGSFAHELNTPLGAVLNNAQAARRFLAQGPDRAPDVLACLDDIVGDAVRAGEVVRRMRGAMRREDLRQVKVDVAAVIRDAVRLVEAEARDRNVSISTVVDPELPSLVGDDIQLVQVVLNLVMNAVDVVATMPEDRRRVTVLGLRLERGTEIRVVDSGPGIAPSQADKIFEPFFTTKADGLGLGLAITRSIVEAHGGRIRVVPAPEGGTAFHVFLPRVEELSRPGPRTKATA